MTTRLLHAIAAVLLTLTVPVSAVPEAHARWGRENLPNAVVVTHEGKAVRFYDDLIKNRMVLISFVYTSCPDICPLVTARLAELQDLLADRLGKSVFFISISIDPERDSPDALKHYAAAFQTRPGWTFITGKPEEIRVIRHKLGERSRRIFEHQNDVVLGNDATGEWARNSAFTDLENLALAIRSLDPEWRAQRRAPQFEAPGPVVLDAARPGAALFTRLCSSCHTIGGGEKIGPDLVAISERRPKEWLASYIKAPGRVRASGDATAASLSARYRSAMMPNLGLADNDVQDVLSFIAARTYAARGTATGETSAPRGEPHHH